MDRLIYPSSLSGIVRIPASKSIAHRAYICNALAYSPAVIECNTDSVDIQATRACLSVLMEDNGNHQAPRVCNCVESGSTLRFLLPLAAALGKKVSFTGAPYLVKRPLSPLCEALQQHGIHISNAGQFPLTVSGQLTPGNYKLPGNISSQFISGLLFALPLLPSDSEIKITGTTESFSYINLTLDMLRQFHIHIEPTIDGFHVDGNQQYLAPEHLTIEADWSSAAFWLAAGAIGMTSPYCSGLNPDSLQGDRAILRILEAFGAMIEYGEDGIRALQGNLHGTIIDASNIPDLVPILAVVAAYAQGKTEFIHAGRLRLKESDRIHSTRDLLSRLGIQTADTQDTLTVYGKTSTNNDSFSKPYVIIDSHNDHRIAMSAAIAATRSSLPVMINGAESVTKSYPDFFEHFDSLCTK